ncbi:phosphotransferase [Arthrobacter sp.]|uniref:phosphotransferase family protein n=1 Tax=Arthrobacter sp. TaxID=1667 RepID=UPI002896CB5E|nr:phosphotransferase [Arthrobacter sp.]
MIAALPTAENEVLAHLVSRGLARSSDDLAAAAMPGGVSNDVVAVTGPGLNVVVKRALGRLRVAQTWLADVSRLATEGRALQEAGRILPGAVPEVLDVSNGFLVMSRAPENWRTWKQDLFRGEVDPQVAERLGLFLGVWQRETARKRQELDADFGDGTAFEQLRVDPFHRQIRDAYPDLAPAIDATLEQMAASTTCLVHGDYTPKNFLVGDRPGQVWVIDWEVAHLGDPSFDPAWTVGHLLLKSIHRPQSADSYLLAARAFLRGLAAVERGVPIDVQQLARQTGCLLLARVDGRSPVEYLDGPGQEQARTLGRRLLADPPATLTDVWKDLK